MKKDLFTISSELDDLQYRMEISAKLVDLAHIAFTEGSCVPQREDFEALYSIYCQQYELCKKLKCCADNLNIYSKGIQANDQDTVAGLLSTLREAYQSGKDGNSDYCRRTSRMSVYFADRPEDANTYNIAVNAMYESGRRRDV